MILLGLFWLVPTLGLLVVSCCDEPGQTSAEGWWTIFTKPAELTIQNYANSAGQRVQRRPSGTRSLITVPTTILVIGISAMAAYAFAVDGLPRPGRGVPRGRRAADRATSRSR
ncbi:hypothetical protein GCM10020220_094910 [Nonomuraea rubra]|uniref:hypothetical protein n=1 Tax=Nonomuraea rubra TaxID=46180 RepID=UPI0031E5CCF7